MLTNLTQNDLDLLALCIWREARGEGNEGMTAVCCVIVNRVGFPGFASTLDSVILGRNQFSSMSIPSDPEYSLHPQAGDTQYAFCQSLAALAQAGTLIDITNGAHYYANLKYSSSGWFFDNIVKNTAVHPLTATIGHQSFYR